MNGDHRTRRSSGTPDRRLLPVAVGLVGVAFGLYAEWAFGRGGAPAWKLAQDVVVGWVFMGAGLVAWRRRPHTRLGPLLVAEGFAWFLANLQGSGVALLFSLGLWLAQLDKAVLAHLILALPSGRLPSRVERIAISSGYAIVVVFGLLRVVAYDPAFPSCPACPSELVLVPGKAANALGLLPSLPFYRAATLGYELVGGALALVILAMVVRRWRSSSGAGRQLLAPVWLSAAVWALVVARATGEAANVLTPAARHGFDSVTAAAQLAAPLIFLAGVLRTRLARGTVGELLVELERTAGARELEEALGRALGDPSCRLAFWCPAMQGYAGADGRTVELPAGGPGRVVGLLEADSRPLAVMIHDPALAEEPELVEVVAAAARLGLENERLQADARVKLDALRASQARIVEAADAARRRVERDLHDGAQQRLVALSLTLSFARSQLGRSHGGDAGLGDALDAMSELGSLGTTLVRASEQVDLALEELRELARGIHPAVLSQGGLAAAVELMAERAPLPVETAIPRTASVPRRSRGPATAGDGCWSRSPTTASGEPTPAGGRASSGWPTGWLRSEAAWRSRAPPAGAPGWRRGCRAPDPGGGLGPAP